MVRGQHYQEGRDHMAKQGSISPTELYTLDYIKEVSGLGDAAMRNARRRGLRVHRTGGRAFIYGADFIGYIRTVADDRKAGEKAL
jgi:hypothetical protein